MPTYAKAIAAELAGRTITGGEFARHVTVTDAIGLYAYFCDPYSPGQRVQQKAHFFVMDLP